MLLKKMINSLAYLNCVGRTDIEISGLCFNSKEAKKGSIFFCLTGTKTNGVLYIDEAIKNGIVAVVIDEKSFSKINLNDLLQATFIVVKNVRKSMAIMSANFYDNPQKRLKLIGITGTSGKTSCSYIIAELLKKNDKKVGVIGTNGIFIGDEKYDAHMTTPDSIELFKIFRDMVKAKVEYCIMEVSAHAIFYNKIYGIKFAVKALTNVKTDHLDFFKTQQNYEKIKQKFFRTNDKAVFDINDKIGKILSKKCKKSINFGKKNANFCILTQKCMLGKTLFKVEFNNNIYEIKSNLTGKFNIKNLSMSICVLIQLGFKMEDIIDKINSIKNLPGRFDIVFQNDGITIIIDYAHTLDSIKNFLLTIKSVSKNKNIIVFGCPGERDTKKRFLIGKLASKLCDTIILTTDNPASENPRRIMFEMEQGVISCKSQVEYYKIENRFSAIKKAIDMAKRSKNYNILIVGKGIENYQIIGDNFNKYSDYDAVNKLVKNHTKKYN